MTSIEEIECLSECLKEAAREAAMAQQTLMESIEEERRVDLGVGGLT